MKASKEQIERLLVKIKEERTSLPQYSSFGDDNWTLLDDFIRILEKALTGVYEPVDYDSIGYQALAWINDVSSSDLASDYE